MSSMNNLTLHRHAVHGLQGATPSSCLHDLVPFGGPSHGFLQVLNVGSSWREVKYEVSLLQAACDCHVPVTEEARQAGRQPPEIAYSILCHFGGTMTLFIRLPHSSRGKRSDRGESGSERSIKVFGLPAMCVGVVAARDVFSSASSPDLLFTRFMEVRSGGPILVFLFSKEKHFRFLAPGIGFKGFLNPIALS
ncbi:hypothetical protein F2Q70_00039356 [Brassica cretica]|uniref:Uncharacterized protein n=1 Tax=Brassica cretica TaxID=69181 RepID=A0A8S9K983_BRACR|nr:hypothetical protein F2Q70_00039356 [Brassica cretica]